MRHPNKPPLIHGLLYSEIALFLFVLGMMTIGYSRGFVQFANAFGALFIVTLGVEFVILRRSRAVCLGSPMMLSPLVGFLVLAVIIGICVLFLFPTYKRAFTYGQVCLLMIGAFNLIRLTGRTWPIDIAMFLGVVLMFGVASGSIVQAAAEGTRYRLSIGSDEHGLNPNLYGALLNFQILFFVRYVFITLPNIRRTKISMAVLLLGLLATLVSSYQILAILGSRQNQLWFLITLGGVVFLGGRGRVQLATLIPSSFLVGMLGVIAIWLVKGSAYFDRFVRLYYELTSGMAEEASGYSRMMMIRIGLDLWVKSPIWGYGNEGFRVNSGLGQYSHNQFVELLVNYGLLGLIAFYSFHVLIVRRAFMMWQSRVLHLRANAIWFIVLMAGVMCSNLFQPTYFQKSFGLVLAAVGGIAYHSFNRQRMPGRM